RLGEDALRVRFWGGAFMSVRAVVRRLVALQARLEVLAGGGLGELGATVWLRRRFGLDAGGAGGHGGSFDAASVRSARAGGHAGIAWWLTPRVAAALAYAPVWQRATPVAGFGSPYRDFSFVAHTVSLSVTVRP